MKRILSFVLMIMLLACAGLAETAVPFSEYQELISLGEETLWEIDDVDSIWRIAAEDGSSVSACLEADRIAALTVELPVGADRALVQQAFGAVFAWEEGALEAFLSLEESGVQTVGEWILQYQRGELREGFYLYAAADGENLFWEPVHGGKQLHAKPDCSGLDVPRLITHEAGRMLDYDGCDHCLETWSAE